MYQYMVSCVEILYPSLSQRMKVTREQWANRPFSKCAVEVQHNADLQLQCEREPPDQKRTAKQKVKVTLLQEGVRVLEIPRPLNPNQYFERLIINKKLRYLYCRKGSELLKYEYLLGCLVFNHRLSSLQVASSMSSRFIKKYI